MWTSENSCAMTCTKHTQKHLYFINYRCLPDKQTQKLTSNVMHHPKKFCTWVSGVVSGCSESWRTIIQSAKICQDKNAVQGCLPSAVVSVSGGGGCLQRGCHPRGGVCLGRVSAQRGVCLGVSAHGMWLPGGVCQTTLVDRMTDMCKNITLLQLCCRR